MKKIRFYKLNKFDRLQKTLSSQTFMKELLNRGLFCLPDDHIKVRSQAIEFLRANGFNVDDNLEWVTWPTNKDYIISVMWWS
jgi:hypothetical protein